jgi:hypothetical protein
MKTSKNTLKVIGASLIVILLFSLNSCATKAVFLNSAVVPAAQGSVKFKKDKNENYVIKIKISNLAESNRLQPPKNTYIVWMETGDDVVKNIGQIMSSKAFMSKKLKASFETVSSFKPKKIFITAEDDANIQYPFSGTVLTTVNF